MMAQEIGLSTMIRIIGGRGSGKTAKLIELSAKYNAPIVYTGHLMKDYYIRELAYKMGVTIPRPFHVSELNKFGGHRIIVDNA